MIDINPHLETKLNQLRLKKAEFEAEYLNSEDTRELELNKLNAQREFEVATRMARLRSHRRSDAMQIWSDRVDKCVEELEKARIKHEEIFTLGLANINKQIEGILDEMSDIDLSIHFENEYLKKEGKPPIKYPTRAELLKEEEEDRLAEEQAVAEKRVRKPVAEKPVKKPEPKTKAKTKEKTKLAKKKRS